MSREVHVRFCESPEVRFLRATHPYVPTYAGFLFLAVVLDAFSRRVVGWATSSNMKTQLVLDALNMAIYRRRPRRRSSLRPGNAVHINRVWLPLPGSEHPPFDGLGRGLLR
jgi:transposase InsO family protein